MGDSFYQDNNSLKYTNITKSLLRKYLATEPLSFFYLCRILALKFFGSKSQNISYYFWVLKVGFIAFKW